MSAAAITALAIASAVISRGAPYAALLFAARLLSQEDFGAFALALLSANLLGAVVSGGGSLWTNRFAADRNGGSLWRDAVRQRYLQIALTLATVTLACALLSALPAPAAWRPLLLAVGAAAAVAGLSEAVFSILRSSGRVTSFFLLRDLAAPLGYLALLLLIVPDSPGAALALLPAATCPPLLIAGLLVRRGGLLHPAAAGRCRGRRLRAIIAHTGKLIVNNLVGRLAVHLDSFVLSLLVSAALLGEYRAAAQLALGFHVVQNAAFLGLPWQLRRQGRPAERQSRGREVRLRQRWLLAASLIALAVILAFAPQLLTLFGPAFADAAPLLRLLCLIRFLDLLWGPQQQLLISNGLAPQDATCGLVGIVVWLGGFAILLSFTQPPTAAAAAHCLAAPCIQALRWHHLTAAGLKAGTRSPLAVQGLSLCYAATLIMTYLMGV